MKRMPSAIITPAMIDEVLAMVRAPSWLPPLACTAATIAKTSGMTAKSEQQKKLPTLRPNAISRLAV